VKIHIPKQKGLSGNKTTQVNTYNIKKQKFWLFFTDEVL